MKYITTKEQVWMRPAEQAEGLLELIANLSPTKDKRMIEIGSFVGESTILFAQSFKEVIAIDPFLEGYDDQDPTSYLFEFKNVHQTYLERTGDYKNIKTIVSTSDDAVSQLLGEQFDFIYIDGLHTYDGVKKDIQNYLKFVKPNGIIGGHDYTDKVPHLVGVKKAVDEMLGTPDKVFKDNSWIKLV